MEENQNVNANPQKKKMGKAKKIVIAIIAILVVVVGVVAVLGFTGKLDFNFTKKSKADAGLGKVGEVFTQTVTDFESEFNDAGLTMKLLDKEINEFEVNYDMSVDVNEIEVDGMDSEDEEILDAIIDIINNVEFNVNAKSNKDKGSLKLGATINEEPVSLEVAYDGEKVGFRSEELNEKWLAVELQEILDEYSDEFELDEESMAELEELMAAFEELITDLVLTNEEVEHFKSTYANMLADYILTLDIESEKDKIEVGDKEKNCTKTTITLDEDDIKNLLISYVEKAEDDKEGQKIVKEKINIVLDFVIENAELFETDLYDYDDYYTYDYDYSPTDTYSIVEEMEDIKESLDEIFATETFDMLKDAIEEIDLEGLEITIESYSTLTTVYATDITFEVDGNGIVVSMVFDGDKTNATIGMKSSGMSMDVAEMTLVNEKNHKSFEVKTAKDIVEYMGSEMALRGDIKIAENKYDGEFELDLGEEGNIKLSQESSVKTNTDTEYKNTTKTNVRVEMPEEVTFDITVNIDYGMKISDIDFTSIDECIDLTDDIVEGYPDEETEEELYQYILDAVPGVVNVLEAVKGFDIVEQEDLEDDIDEAIDMLESLSMEDLKEIITTEPVIEEQTGTGIVEQY